MEEGRDGGVRGGSSREQEVPTTTKAELRTTYSPGTRTQALSKRLHWRLGTISQLRINKIGYKQQQMPSYYYSTTRGRT